MNLISLHTETVVSNVNGNGEEKQNTHRRMGVVCFRLPKLDRVGHAKVKTLVEYLLHSRRLRKVHVTQFRGEGLGLH